MKATSKSLIPIIILLAFSHPLTGCKKKTPVGGGSNPSPSGTPSGGVTYRTDLPGVCAAIPDGKGAANPSYILPTYRGAVNTAQDTTNQETNHGLKNGSGVPKNIKDYTDAIIERLDRTGYCGVWDGYRLHVRKQGQDKTEVFQLVKNNGVEVSEPYYEATYSPALPFPHSNYPTDFHDGDPGCNLLTPTIAQVDASQQTEIMGAMLGSVQDQIDSISFRLRDEEQAHSTGLLEPFSGGNAPFGWCFTSKNAAAVFAQRVRAELRELGICTAQENENFTAKTNSGFSEFYDLGWFAHSLDRYCYRVQYHSRLEPANF